MDAITYCLRRRWASCTGLVVLATLAGCASEVIQSRPATGTDTAQSGLVYALPKGQLQVALSRKVLDKDEVAKAEADAAASADAAKKEVALQEKLKAAADRADGQLKTALTRADLTPALRNQLTRRAELAGIELAYQIQRVTAAKEKAASAAKRAADVKANQGKCEETVAITQLPPVPDPVHRYIASLDHGFTRDDKLKLSVVNGMLSSSNAQSTDQTPGILLNLVQSFAAAGTPRAAAPVWQPQIDKSKVSCVPDAHSTVFDPTDPQETREQFNVLRDKFPGIVLEVADLKTATPPPKAGEGQAKGANPAQEGPQVRDAAGLLYRAPRAVRINVKATADANKVVPNQSQVMVFPDAATLFRLTARAGAFTTGKFDFVFKDGMPADFSVEQPSELAAIAGLPVDIAKALISVPASLIKLRVDYDSQANAAIEAQTAALQAELARLRAQRELDAAIADDTPAE